METWLNAASLEGAAGGLVQWNNVTLHGFDSDSKAKK